MNENFQYFFVETNSVFSMAGCPPKLFISTVQKTANTFASNKGIEQGLEKFQWFNVSAAP
jgi:hypothetical protein